MIVDLARYVRRSGPAHEAAPRDPVHAVELLSPQGVPFVLVREAIGTDHVGRMASWLIWREDECVGFVGATIGPGCGSPFDGARHITGRDQVWPVCAIHIFQAFMAGDPGHEHPGISQQPSRGPGIMTRAYLEMNRQVIRIRLVSRLQPTRPIAGREGAVETYPKDAGGQRGAATSALEENRGAGSHLRW